VSEQPATRPDRPDEDGELRVTTLELFFDLVFVFTITQLTSVLTAEPNGFGLAKMAALLAVLWWMYGGYAWLTNVVPPVRTVPRLLLVASMGGFLVAALAVPTAFGAGGLAFGLGYLVVVVVHTGLFLRSPSRAGILRVAPWNLGAAALLVAAAFLPVGVRWAVWLAVPLALWGVSHLGSGSGFSLRPAHFVERHGLVLLIAFGESVVAIGVGAGDIRLNAGVLLAAVLTLLVLAGLWWCYFGGEDELAERRLLAADPSTRTRLSLSAFGRAFYPLLAGIILLAAGVKRAIGHPFQAGHLAPAVAIGCGVALFLGGDVVLRRILRLGPVRARTAALVLVLASIVAGVFVSPVAQLAGIGVVLLGALRLESGSAPPTTSAAASEPENRPS
jgi:low temperature requirement protein LtrA